MLTSFCMLKRWVGDLTGKGFPLGRIREVGGLVSGKLDRWVDEQTWMDGKAGWLICGNMLKEVVIS